MKKLIAFLVVLLLVAVPASAQTLKVSESNAVRLTPSVYSSFVSPVFFIETSVNQMKLAVDVDFLARLQYNMVTQARVVLSETGIGSTHAKRAAYAANVINSPESFARVAAVMIVGGVNLIGTVTIDGAGKASSSVTDAALLSQVATYWNALAGIDSGS